MSKQEANEILSRWKFGIANYPLVVINHALFVTGDLDA